MKKCTKCLDLKYEGEFDLLKRKYRRSICKECRKAECRAHWAKNKVRFTIARKASYAVNGRRWHLKRWYNMTLEEYNQRLKDQDNVCAICHQKANERLSIDHSHITNRNRGLLCRKCNFALGLLGEDTTRFESAIKYLQLWLKK